MPRQSRRRTIQKLESKVEKQREKIAKLEKRCELLEEDSNNLEECLIGAAKTSCARAKRIKIIENDLKLLENFMIGGLRTFLTKEQLDTFNELFCPGDKNYRECEHAYQQFKNRFINNIPITYRRTLHAIGHIRDIIHFYIQDGQSKRFIPPLQIVDGDSYDCITGDAEYIDTFGSSDVDRYEAYMPEKPEGLN